MIHIYRLNESHQDEMAKLLSLEYMTDYVMEDTLFAYGMYVNNELKGIALINDEGINVELHYLYVDDDCKFFLSYFIDSIAYDMYNKGAQKLVYHFLEGGDSDLIKTLKRNGFVVNRDEIAMFEFTIKQLSEIPLLSSSPRNVISLEELDNIRLRNICTDIMEANEDIVDMPLNKNEYLANCSAVYMKEDKARGLLLLQRDKDGKLLIPYIYSNSTEPMAIVDMIKFTFNTARKQFDENESCRTYVVDPVLVKIVEKITMVSPRYRQSAVYDLSNMQRYIDAYNLNF